MNTPLSLVTNKPDAEIAEELKNKIVEVYKPLLALLDEATDKGFIINIQTGTDAFGKQVISQLIIAKKY